MGRPKFLPNRKPKMNLVKMISDFRSLNMKIKRNLYPMPKINDILLKLEGFKYTMSLDLDMGYYHIWLIKYAINLCMIILPWGKYQYKHLPMGVSNSPEISRKKICSKVLNLYIHI